MPGAGAALHARIALRRAGFRLALNANHRGGNAFDNAGNDARVGVERFLLARLGGARLRAVAAHAKTDGNDIHGPFQAAGCRCTASNWLTAADFQSPCGSGGRDALTHN